MTVFDPQTLSESVRSRSVADPVRCGNVFTDIYCCRSVDERDTTKTSRMGLWTIRTLTDELRMRYGRATDTKVAIAFTEKSNSFDFSVTS